MYTEYLIALTAFTSLVPSALVQPFVPLPVCVQSAIRRRAMDGLLALIILIVMVGCNGGPRVAPSPTETTTTQDAESLEMLFFWSSACATCSYSEDGQRQATQAQRSQQARLIVDDLSARYPDLAILSFEVTYHPENRQHLESLAESLGITEPSVPMAFIGSAYWTEFGEKTMHEMEAWVVAHLD